MEKLFYTLDQYKSQARLYHKNMKEMGLEVSYMQAMQLLAKSLNYKSWEVLETKVLENELVFKVNSSSEITLNLEKSNNVWITVNNISVYVKANDEGVSVDLYPLEREDSDESLAATYAFYAEVENVDEKLTEKEQKELLIEWDKSNKKFKNTVRAYDIKKGYNNSTEKSMYSFQEYMVDNLMKECGDLFKNRNEAEEFLFKKDNEHITLPTYHTKKSIENIYSQLKGNVSSDSDIVVIGDVSPNKSQKNK